MIQFKNPLTNLKGFLSSEPGGFFAPPQREGLEGLLSDPRVNIGLAIASGQPIGQAILGGALQAQKIDESFEERKFKQEERDYLSKKRSAQSQIQDYFSSGGSLEDLPEEVLFAGFGDSILSAYISNKYDTSTSLSKIATNLALEAVNLKGKDFDNWYDNLSTTNKNIYDKYVKPESKTIDEVISSALASNNTNNETPDALAHEEANAAAKAAGKTTYMLNGKSYEVQ
tara:strand:- start:3053 stop:3736 length:684 start_codon:yes stop_codon:yes gene_type:complete